MELVSWQYYRDFLSHHNGVRIGDSEIKLRRGQRVDRLGPELYLPEEWTVWSFPDRGSWATHAGDYPGNWSPFVPRNLLHRYTRIGETVCDPMAGGGTTLVECKLMGRNAVGIDVNPEACIVAINRLDFAYELPGQSKTSIEVYYGDARNLDAIGDACIDLVAIHPPYAGMIRYCKEETRSDLSHLGTREFIHEMGIVAKECFRILKPSRHCAVLIGDTRTRGHYVPLSVAILTVFLEAGFILKEEVIKIQHQTRSARERWTDSSYNFLKIGHEHLFIFRRPANGESVADYPLSSKWWDVRDTLHPARLP
jgi:DNA modification methylase